MFTSSPYPSVSPPDVDPDLAPDFDGATHVAISERTRFQPRRTSALAYQNSAIRDARDRSSPRSPKNLIVVMPPPDFPLDQRQLGHVLSVGPRHRLPQGLLLPLFPSMFGQLNAIAREFNFPSTAGLCLYLHVNENGISMTPRISDDSWQYLFGHLFETRQPSAGQSPIGGCIEFDIDLNKARWFDAWASGVLRDPEPVFVHGAHRRKESLDGQPVDDRWDDSGPQTLLANSRPETLRHVPRKLSLVDRLETHSVYAPPKPQNHLDRPSSPPKLESRQLSPIPQSAVPPPASKTDLEHRVHSWRASTELYPVSMLEAYQEAPDAGVSAAANAMDEYALGHNARQAVNVDEFHWSISSVGPRSPVAESPVASTWHSSVHLDRRANGSVPATPTTATSWGPADDDWYSVISDESRLPSPHIGERVVEDSMAPRYNAVWGNSFGWRSETTWTKVYPYSDPQTMPIIRVRLQESAVQYPNLVIYPTVSSPSPKRPEPSCLPVWGTSFGWKGAATWRLVYPYSTETMQSITPTQLRGIGGLVPKYPNLCIYPAVYPYSEIYPACTVEKDTSRPVFVALTRSNDIMTSYPNLIIYPTVYPHLQIYPSVVKMPKQKEASAVGSLTVHLSSTDYPYFVIYAPVYPHFDIYPAHAATVKVEAKQTQCTANLVQHYPDMVIYPAVYPHLDVYPATVKTLHAMEGGKGLSNLRRRRIEMWRTKTAAQVRLTQLLANNHTWEAEDPLCLDLAEYAWSQTSAGPPTSPLEFADTPSVAGSVYIDGRVRGSVGLTPSTATTWGPPDDDWKWDVISIDRLPSPDLGQRDLDDTENPQFSHRPWGMVWPFLGAASQAKALSSVPVPAPACQYPRLVIYPPIYPHFELYPSLKNAFTLGDGVADFPRSINSYPIFDLYPAVYPYFDIYRAKLRVETPSKTVSDVQRKPVPVKLPSLYPNFDIYPACYPHNLECIYPPRKTTQSPPILVESSCAYPWLVIYPPVYPYIIPYPALSAQQSKMELSPVPSPVGQKPCSMKLPDQYPMLELHPAGYPWTPEYPAISRDDRIGGVKPYYPHVLIYSPVYPFVQAYPTNTVHVPGALDESEYSSAVASLAQSKVKRTDLVSTDTPHSELCVVPATLASQQGRTAQNADVIDLVKLPPRTPLVKRRKRKTHLELHASVFRYIEKRPARHSKTHLQLHTEVFRDGIVWTPSGYTQDLDLPSLATKQRVAIPVQEASPYPLYQERDDATPRPSRLRSGTTTAQSPDRIVFPLGQPPAVAPMFPLRSSPGVPSQPAPAVSESPIPRVASPPRSPSRSAYTHVRSTSARLSQAVKSMMPSAQRRSSSTTPGSPPPCEDHKKDGQPSPRSWVDRRPTAAMSPSHANGSEVAARTSQGLQRKDSMVMQRARAWEQSAALHR